VDHAALTVSEGERIKISFNQMFASFTEQERWLVRGLGQARTGKLDAADTSLREMRAIVAQIAVAKDLDVEVRARILDVQAKQLNATLLLARKQNEVALKKTPGRRRSVEGLARAKAEASRSR
jgi:hypothetical protein